MKRTLIVLLALLSPACRSAVAPDPPMAETQETWQAAREHVETVNGERFLVFTFEDWSTIDLNLTTMKTATISPLGDPPDQVTPPVKWHEKDEVQPAPWPRP